MDANNPVAAALEEETGVKTFSTSEMSFMLTALCSDTARLAARTAPLAADLTGGFSEIEDLRGTVDGIRQRIEDGVATIAVLAGKNDSKLATELSRLGRIYVNDAFGSMHRSHASIDAVVPLMESGVAGFLVQGELDAGVGQVGKLQPFSGWRMPRSLFRATCRDNPSVPQNPANG